MLYFVEAWGADKKNTWSGTPWHLLQSISNFVCVEEKDIKLSCIEKIVKKLWRVCCKLLCINDAGILDLIYGVRCINTLEYIYKSSPLLVFGDFRSNYIADTYIFIDCSVDFIYRNMNSEDNYVKFLPCAKKKWSFFRFREENALDFYRSCKGIFTMGQWIADDLIENTGLPIEKVHCVGGGVNVNQDLVDISKKDGKRFLFIGKDFDRKNGPLVVEAFTKLNTEYNNKYELYIAGPKKWPLSQEIPDGVHFLGLKTADELVDYYNLCDVFVMPSVFEAYGLVFAEALVFGLPIIARDAFAMKDFIKSGDNGYLLKSDSAEDLAQLMHSAIEDAGMRNRVCARRKKYAEYYSWDAVARRIINVINKDGYIS